MRLDVYLAEQGMVRSRQLAKDMIKSGKVTINGKTADKPSKDISDTDVVEIIGEMPRYVGRGGLKLEKALSAFGINVSGRICADIGASTGGFTDCMLQSGAGYVYALDVGHDQLDPSLLADERVCSMEGTNIKDVDRSSFDKEISFVCTDVSFISLTKVIPKIYEILSENGEAVMLIKPQFECGKQDIGKNGIVRSPKVHERVIKDIAACCECNSLGVHGIDYSPVQGGDGNIEYLIYVKKNTHGIQPDISAIVRAAHDKMKKEQ